MAVTKLATLMFNCLAGNEKINTDIGTLVLDFPLHVNCHRTLETFNVGHEHGQRQLAAFGGSGLCNMIWQRLSCNSLI